jgi:divalent metal cation (Fe/Co/Zn/Cd) transporter
LAIDAIMTYRASNVLHVNISCMFAPEHNIAEVHDMVTKIEQAIKQRLGDVIVTIHPEPVRKENQ